MTTGTGSGRLIDRWFPVAAVDEACGTPVGSGRNEKAIFTWFASRPIAQARAAMLCSLLTETSEDGDKHLRDLVDAAVRRGDSSALGDLASRIPDVDGKRPVVLDCFSGRGIIPLEAARIGLRAVGMDLSPVAALASRLLAEWPLRDWSSEPPVCFALPERGGESEDGDEQLLFGSTDGERKFVDDLRRLFAEIDRRVETAVAPQFPKNADGSYPWGYLWCITMPCDKCHARFPVVGSLVLRHPYRATGDRGQSLVLRFDKQKRTWSADVEDGTPSGPPTFAASQGRRGKSARCPFCEHPHPLATVKAKGFAHQYEDAPLVAADLESKQIVDDRGRSRTVELKVFRPLRPEEVTAAMTIDLGILPSVGGLSAVPDETIGPGNNHCVRASAYGYTAWASLMNARQALVFAETICAIRSCYSELLQGGISQGYAQALASYAAANLVRRTRRSTKGAKLLPHGKPNGSEQNRVQVDHIFSDESKVAFNFDWFEAGPGDGPGTWRSLTETTLTPLGTHISGLSDLAVPGRFRQGSATQLPYRDATVDAVVVDPPYYSMIDYADVSDLFYVWLRRCLFDIVPDLFGRPGNPEGLQDKSHEIIVKDSAGATGDHRTREWYEQQLSVAFGEIRRVLKPDGTLTVVFGHSDPDAWRRLLGALRAAQFVVTSAWPARTESANTGVASIKVTVTIGCRVAPSGRRSATAAQVEREITEMVRGRVGQWEAWGLALSDQLMASYGPAMQVVGRYRSIQRPDGTEPDLDHFLSVGRRAVADAHAFKVDELPLDTFDPLTRFAIFWLRAFGRTAVNKGEAVFHAQSSELRIDALRPIVLEEVKGGFALTLAPPGHINERSSVIEVARALAAAWPAGGTEAAAQVLLDAERPADDAHMWATVGELVRQLPESDRLSLALTACQRNRQAIEAARRTAARAAREASYGVELPFDEFGGR
jgi:putative DNA methylase